MKLRRSDRPDIQFHFAPAHGTDMHDYDSLPKKQNGFSGSDVRVCLIELDCLIQLLDVSVDIKQLLRTAVQISKILYCGNESRSP